MKTTILLITILFISSFVIAQPCRTVKPGMTKEEVIKAAGKPDNIIHLGVEKATKDSLFLWNYGNQQVSFKGNKVENVIADQKGLNGLFKQMQNGTITKEEFNEQTEDLNNAACE